MNFFVRRLLPAVLLVTAVLTFASSSQAQDTNVATRAAITVLDSTKEQDGLLGSVRRVKTETAKIALKDGRAVEEPLQLVEITTYGITGNRVDNTSYPIKGGLVGKEEYKYDERGNITEMTVRDDRGAILSREAYSYEFDKFGNWTKMITSLVVFEDGALKREPVEVTYRTVTYYYDDTIAKIVDNKPKPQEAPAVPAPRSSVEIAAEPQSVFMLAKSAESAESAVKVTTDNTDPNANDLFLAGRDFLSLHKDREAIKAFKDSIKLNPNVAEAHYGLGFANFRMGRFRDAVDAFKKATQLAPQMAKAHYGLSLAYQELGMHTQLLDEYRILQTLDKTLAKKLAQTFPQFNFSCRALQGCP